MIPLEIDEHCVGCYYYRGEAALFCCYLLVTDKKRPCPPGKDCTVRIRNAYDNNRFHMHTCSWCGRKFISQRVNAKYCSKSCASSAKI